MKKIFLFIIAAVIATLNVSCVEKTDEKSNIYAETHKIYNNKDSIYSGITVYYAKVKGHDVVYHIFDGKRKCQMEIWHFKNECLKCSRKK